MQRGQQHPGAGTLSTAWFPSGFRFETQHGGFTKRHPLCRESVRFAWSLISAFCNVTPLFGAEHDHICFKLHFPNKPMCANHKTSRVDARFLPCFAACPYIVSCDSAALGRVCEGEQSPGWEGGYIPICFTTGGAQVPKPPLQTTNSRGKRTLMGELLSGELPVFP